MTEPAEQAASVVEALRTVALLLIRNSSSSLLPGETAEDRLDYLVGLAIRKQARS